MTDMKHVRQLVPSAETLQLWADELIPEDVWYWDDSPLDLDLTGCQVMTRETYRSDPTYHNIRYMNAYCEWQMSAEVTRVIVSDQAWIGSLSVTDRQRVLQKQVELKRGRVFSIASFGELPSQLQEYAVADQVVLGQAVWAGLPTAIQHRALLAEQRGWDDLDYLPVPDTAPQHVQAVANTYVPHEGTNCFAISVYGATANPELLTTWLTVSPVDVVTPLGYRLVPDVEPITNDIVIIELEGRVVHAVWCIDDDRFLNKGGQSRVSPIRVVDWKMLDANWLADWPDTTFKVYRRGTA